MVHYSSLITRIPNLSWFTTFLNLIYFCCTELFSTCQVFLSKWSTHPTHHHSLPILQEQILFTFFPSHCNCCSLSHAARCSARNSNLTSLLCQLPVPFPPRRSNTPLLGHVVQQYFSRAIPFTPGLPLITSLKVCTSRRPRSLLVCGKPLIPGNLWLRTRGKKNTLIKHKIELQTRNVTIEKCAVVQEAPEN
jgi:hypothetical protein